MGSGNIGSELRGMAEVLVAAGLTARQTIQLHLEVVEELAIGLGARSTRHVMTRADLLVMGLMLQLGRGLSLLRYQEQFTRPCSACCRGLNRFPPCPSKTRTHLVFIG